jgi:hypothetical protein
VYVRLVSFSGADQEKRDRALQTMQERVIPTLREYDGYAGYLGLYGADNGRAAGVILWNDRDSAEAAESSLTERRREMAGAVGLTVESADLYDVLVNDMKQGG